MVVVHFKCLFCYTQNKSHVLSQKTPILTHFQTLGCLINYHHMNRPCAGFASFWQERSLDQQGHHFILLFVSRTVLHTSSNARLRHDTKMTLMQYDVPLQGTSMLTLARNVFLLMLSIVALYFMSELNEALGRQTIAVDACEFQRSRYRLSDSCDNSIFIYTLTLPTGI